MSFLQVRSLRLSSSPSESVWIWTIWQASFHWFCASISHMQCQKLVPPFKRQPRKCMRGKNRKWPSLRFLVYQKRESCPSWWSSLKTSSLFSTSALLREKFDNQSCWYISHDTTTFSKQGRESQIQNNTVSFPSPPSLPIVSARSLPWEATKDSFLRRRRRVEREDASG